MFPPIFHFSVSFFLSFAYSCCRSVRVPTFPCLRRFAPSFSKFFRTLTPLAAPRLCLSFRLTGQRPNSPRPFLDAFPSCPGFFSLVSEKSLTLPKFHLSFFLLPPSPLFLIMDPCLFFPPSFPSFLFHFLLCPFLRG